MATNRIYRQDQYQSECKATVTAVREKDGFDLIACDQTVFYPEGGGQPSDFGTMSLGDKIYEISHASDESIDSDVWHLSDAPSGTIKAGDTVILSIDYDHRFRNMQRHLGEHMLSGAINSLFDGSNKGFHIGDGYVSIDIDAGGRMLTDEELDLAERTVNEAIWADLPVTVEWFDSYEESLIRPVRKPVPHEGRVSIVTVGSLEDPLDCIACCGVHPSRSSEVGLISIYRSEPNKGMQRIFFDCGASALDKLSADSHILKEIAASYSCQPSDVPSRLAAEADNISAMKNQIAELTSYVKESEKESIIKEINTQKTKVHSYESDILSPDDMLKMGFDLIHDIDDLLLFMISPASNTCLLLSSKDNVKCGQIVKEMAGMYDGKGGGRDDNARAMFEKASNLEAFIEAVKEKVS